MGAKHISRLHPGVPGKRCGGARNSSIKRGDDWTCPVPGCSFGLATGPAKAMRREKRRHIAECHATIPGD
eukprot:12316294-Alexandrium_andersonii.AAC.1